MKKIISILILAFFIIMIGFSIFDYNNYLQGQNCAVDLMMSTSDRYDDFYGSHNELVKKMYNDLHPTKYSYNIGGYDINNSEEMHSALEVDEALGTRLSEKGYDCYSGSYYLEYTGFAGYFSYTINNCIDGGVLCICYVASICGVIFLAIYRIMNKNRTTSNSET